MQPDDEINFTFLENSLSDIDESMKKYIEFLADADKSALRTSVNMAINGFLLLSLHVLKLNSPNKKFSNPKKYTPDLNACLSEIEKIAQSNNKIYHKKSIENLKELRVTAR